MKSKDDEMDDAEPVGVDATGALKIVLERPESK